MNKVKLFQLYPDFNMVYGPYKRSDGRQHVILTGIGLDNKQLRKTVSYPKLLAELVLGRRLIGDETVDHQDRDYANNSFSNFVIRPKVEHASLDSLRVFINDVNCPICNKSFTPTRNQLGERTLNKPGPFCSRACASSYQSKIRNGFTKIERSHVEVIHYRLDKI